VLAALAAATKTAASAAVFFRLFETDPHRLFFENVIFTLKFSRIVCFGAEITELVWERTGKGFGALQ
jgi:hypothetical protein